ncbi:MAG: helix-turn-helix domain-containing protein [Dehalococcoidia bacterium]|nr:helix-turn-helix domain-containing protein [Dehalococcoidia bacterium]
MATSTMDRGAFRMKEAEAYLAVSRDTLDRLIRRGEIASFTVGRNRYISARELDRFIADREAAAS